MRPFHREGPDRRRRRTRRRSPGAPETPSRPMVPRIRSFAPTPRPGSPSMRTRMVRGTVWGSVCVASTCSTSEVPIPNASAPKAPWVEVCESPQTIVMPGWVRPSSGPMTWTMPCRGERIENSGIAELGAVALERLDLRTREHVLDPLLAPDRRHVVVDRRDRAVRAADLAARQPQPVEGLRRGHLMHEVQVDVQQRRPVRAACTHLVRLPQLLEERLAHRCQTPPAITRSPCPARRLASTARRYATAVASRTSVETPWPE